MSPVELTSDMRRRSSEKRAISRPRRKSATHKKGCRTRRPSAAPLTSGALPSGRRRDGGSVSRKKRLTSATTLRPSAHEQPYARRTERDARLPPTKVDAAKPRPRAAEMRDCSIARRVALRPSVSARLAWKESQKIGTDADVTKRATISIGTDGNATTAARESTATSGTSTSVDLRPTASLSRPKKPLTSSSTSAEADASVPSTFAALTLEWPPIAGSMSATGSACAITPKHDTCSATVVQSKSVDGGCGNSSSATSSDSGAESAEATSSVCLLPRCMQLPSFAIPRRPPAAICGEAVRSVALAVLREGVPPLSSASAATKSIGAAASATSRTTAKVAEIAH